MNFDLYALVRDTAAIAVGGAIGYGFGLIQSAALRRHTRLQAQGKFQSGWAATPGSFRRVAYLMVALALVQVACPILFAAGTVSPWLVSSGVVAGYGWILFAHLRRSRA